MSDCNVCSVPIQNRQTKISCSDCKMFCHGTCVNMTKSDIDCITKENKSWRCPPCSEERRKSMAANSAAENPSITDVITMLKEAKEDRRKMEAQFNTSFEFASSKIDDQSKLIEEQNKKLDECLKNISNLSQENVDLKAKIYKLETRLEEVEQYSRSNSVEIFGVPEEKGEDVYEIVRKVGVSLDMNITREQIDVCHRLGKPRESQRPAGIIVKFVRRDDKLSLIAKRKVKRNLSTQQLGFKQPAEPVYINESLSPERRKLYSAARAAKKSHNYTYLWTQNGRILMRKEPGSAIVRVSTMDDLNKL